MLQFMTISVYPRATGRCRECRRSWLTNGTTLPQDSNRLIKVSSTTHKIKVLAMFWSELQAPEQPNSSLLVGTRLGSSRIRVKFLLASSGSQTPRLSTMFVRRPVFLHHHFAFGLNRKMDHVGSIGGAGAGPPIRKLRNHRAIHYIISACARI